MCTIWDLYWEVITILSHIWNLADSGWFFAKMAEFFRERLPSDEKFVLLPSCAQYGTFIEKLYSFCKILKIWLFLAVICKMAELFAERWLWDGKFVLLPLCAQYGTFIEKLYPFCLIFEIWPILSEFLQKRLNFLENDCLERESLFYSNMCTI